MFEDDDGACSGFSVIWGTVVDCSCSWVCLKYPGAMFVTSSYMHFHAKFLEVGINHVEAFNEIMY